MYETTAGFRGPPDTYGDDFWGYIKGLGERYGDAAWEVSRYNLGDPKWELRPSADLLEKSPACVVAVPIATLYEPVDGVVHTLEEIKKGLGDMGPAEVVAWATTKMERTPRVVDAAATAAAMDKMNELTMAIRKRFPGERILLGHRFLPVDVDMAHVRFGHMDIIGHEAYVRRFPGSTPVVWFDADTTFIDDNAIAHMIGALNNGEAHIVKGMMTFGTRPDEARPIGECTDAEKVARVYSLARWLLESTLGPTDERLYHDENGTCFSIGDWVRMGAPVDPRQVGVGENRMLVARAKEMLPDDRPVITYITNAQYGTSDRRIVAQAKRGAVAEIPFNDANRDYQPFTMMPSCDDVPRKPISVGDVCAMLRNMAEQHPAEPEAFNPTHKARIKDLVRLCAFYDNGPVEF